MRPGPQIPGTLVLRSACLLVLTLALVGLGEPANAGEPLVVDQSAARKLYTAKCAKCHKFYEPKKFNDSDWEKSYDSMSRKSKLKPDQKALLQQYLADYRAGKIEKIPGSK